MNYFKLVANKMTSFLYKQRFFFFAYVGFVLLSFFIVFNSDKEASVVFFQTRHNHFWDYCFYAFTLAFESPYLFIFFILILCWSRQKFIILFLAYALSSLIAQGLKRVFAHVRPAEFFETQQHINLYSYLKIRGEELPHFFSFPSGHTTVSFALLSILAFYLPNFWKFFCLIIAIMMGISRVYLACHFWEDIFLGSVVGVLSAAFVFITLERKVDSFVVKKYYYFTKKKS